MTRHDAKDPPQFGRVIRRILITLLTGGLAYSITTMSDQPQIWVLTITVFISGVTLVVQFMAEFDIQIHRVTRKMEALAKAQEVNLKESQSLIGDGFARMNEVTELFRAVETSSLRTDSITQLVRNSTQIDPCAPSLINEFAESQICRTSQLLKELSEGGVVSHDGEDREWLLALTMKSEHTINATSLWTVDGGPDGFHGGLWTSEFGQRFLVHQRDAIDRGVTIRRIFILDGSRQAPDTEFSRIYQQQKDFGIQARVLDRFTIPATLKNFLFDFIVFDDAISYEVTAGSRVEEDTRPTIVKTHLTLQSQRVRERMQKYEELWNAAEEFHQLRSVRTS